MHTYFGVPWKQGCVFKQFFHVQRDKENIVYGWEQGEGWVAGVRGQLCGIAELFHKEDDGLLGVDFGSRLHSTGDQWRWLHSFRRLYEHDASSTAQEAIRPLWRCEERQAGKEALRPQGELVEQATGKHQDQRQGDMEFLQHVLQLSQPLFKQHSSSEFTLVVLIEVACKKMKKTITYW